MQKTKPHICLLNDTLQAVGLKLAMAISRHKVSLHNSPYIFPNGKMKLDITPVRPKNKIKIFTGK